jgi:hypothetical protein
MLFSFEKGEYATVDHHKSNSIDASPENLTPYKIPKIRREYNNTESPKRITREHDIFKPVKPVCLPKQKVSPNRNKLLQNIKSHRKMHKTDIYSNDYDDKDFVKQK